LLIKFEGGGKGEGLRSKKDTRRSEETYNGRKPTGRWTSKKEARRTKEDK